jgi:hypothetical protein
MEMYIWLAIAGWLLTGLIALGMDIYEHPAMRENIGWAEVWPMMFGPMWLLAKLGSWFVWGNSA